MQGLFGKIEVAKKAYKGGEYSTRLFSVDAVEFPARYDFEFVAHVFILLMTAIGNWPNFNPPTESLTQVRCWV
jgi:hypothetical protein